MQRASPGSAGYGASRSRLLTDADDATWTGRLTAYWAARDRYLTLGRNVEPTADVHRMLAQVRAPLLAVLHVSPDFRPAYDPLLRMAIELADAHPAAARRLFSRS
jgi:spermidine synthase